MTLHCPRTGPESSDRNPDGVRFRSAPYLRALERIRKFAITGRAPILIEGESGTGKTTIARHLHEISPRAAGPYRVVALSALDDSLAGSELFGHVAGAFTDARHTRAGHFVSANGGTLLLDEIGKASRSVQQKLLHAIEHGDIRAVGSDREIRVDVRVVVASNIPLAHLVERNEFLPDLYARLETFRVLLPPLRDRRADIPDLVAHYAAKHAPDCGYLYGTPRIDTDLAQSLQAAAWPGNLRQLDATMHRLMIESEGAATITLAHCVDDLAYLRETCGPRAPLTNDTISAAIASAGSISGAARLLGVDRTTVHRFQRRTASRHDAPAPPVAQQSADGSHTVAPHVEEQAAAS